jgi:hypothetical protein
VAFRNDLEATRQRLAALEEELADARKSAAEGNAAKRRVAALEKELATFRAAEAAEAAETARNALPTPVEPPMLQIKSREERDEINRLVAAHERRERAGYFVAAMLCAGVAYALGLPHQTGHWIYTALVLIGGAAAGAYLLYAWRDSADWTDLIGPFAGVLFFGGALGLLPVRLKGEQRLECLARHDAERSLRTAYDARVSAVERLEGVAVGDACTLSIAFVHPADDECSKTCDVELRCGDTSVMRERALSSCRYVAADQRLKLSRATKPKSGDPPISVDMTLAPNDGEGQGAVYHDPGKGRLPWRLELRFGPGASQTGASETGSSEAGD